MRYWVDRQVFPKNVEFVYEELVTRVRQTSFLVQGLAIVVRDERRKPGTPGALGTHVE